MALQPNTDLSPSSSGQLLDSPYRGDGSDRPLGVPLPPHKMPWFRAGRLLKRWRYVSLWSRDLSICAANISVGPVRQEFWAVWDRKHRQLWERTRLCPCCVTLVPNRLLVRDGGITIDVTLDEQAGFEVVVPDGQAYTWTRKQLVRAYGTVHLSNGPRQVEAMVLIDDNAGYHPRHTRWRWSGGAGQDTTGRAVGWSVIDGLNDPAHNSERTVWIDGVPQEVSTVSFEENLAGVVFHDGAQLHFQAEAARERRDNLLLVRSTYRQPFGTFTGALPGGIHLREAYGVMEWHEAVW